MYIPISENDEKFYNEGFVVRFYKGDGTDWVANFQTGWTTFSTIFELPSIDKFVVIANGQGYIMSTDDQKPLNTFGLGMTELIAISEGRFVAANVTDLIVINRDGSTWRSERISWDGIKDLAANGNIVMGYSYDPMKDADEWVPFYFNVDTKLVEKGSYRHDGYNKKKPFWKFW